MSGVAWKGDRLRKPRTNEDAARYWAQSMLLDEAPPAAEANSVGISTRRVPVGRAETGEQVWAEKTIVTSFGWYAMGVIVRDPDGRVVRVVTNRDQYPSRGFAHTPRDQGDVDACAREAVDALNKRRPKSQRIEVEKIPLTGTHLYYHRGPKDMVPCIPRADDPEPSIYRREIRRVFYANDPGPEPVDDGVGCIAGREEEYEYQEKVYTFAANDAVRLTGWRVRSYAGDNDPDYAVMRTGVLRWRNADDVHVDDSGTVYNWGRDGQDKICPHCARFAGVHKRWSVAMHGATYGRKPGYAEYVAMLKRYGSIEGWREEWRAQGRREYASRKAHREWTERNFIPFDAVSTDMYGIPRLRDGRALRKDADRYFQRQREGERQERRRQREHAARERHRRQVERFKERARRKRAAKRDPFFVSAENVATALAEIRSFNDSQGNA